MKTRFRHRLVLFVLRPFFKIFFKLKYNAKLKLYKAKDEAKPPFLVFGNHAMAIDPILMSCSFRHPIHYVASDMIFSIKYWSFFIKFLAAPIPKTKYRSDLATIRDIKSIVKNGGSIGVFPEGNSTFSGRTMSIPKSTAKLVKLLKIPVLFYRFEGTYLSKPRWARYSRKGKLKGYVKEVWPYEAYKDLSTDEIYDYIINRLFVDQIKNQEQSDVSYRGKRIAEDLESTYFYCPNCQRYNTLFSSDDEVKCQACDLHLRFTEKGFFEPLQEKINYFSKTTDWLDAQIKSLKNHIKQLKPDDSKPLFENDGERIYENIPNRQKKFLGQAKLSLYQTHITLTFAEKEIVTWPLKELNVAVQQKNKLIIHNHRQNVTYYALADPKRNALKYALVVQYLTKTEVS